MPQDAPEPKGTYDEQTALVVVDMQNDFAHPEGSLYVEGGHEMVPQVNAEIAEARARGALVVYTQDSHPESTPHFEKDGGPWPVHGVIESWGWEFHPDLAVDAAAPTVRKGEQGGDGYSGFAVRDPESGREQDTQLDSLLQDHGIQRVVVIGLAQDFCVRQTALDATDRGYDTRVLTEVTAPVNLQPEDGHEALDEMAEAGAKLV